MFKRVLLRTQNVFKVNDFLTYNYFLISITQTPDDYSDYIQNLTGVDLRVTTKPAPYAYDAVWAGALAINSSYSQLGRESLLNFSNPTFYQSEVLMSNLNSTQFDGVSVRKLLIL